jgi:hypothetical protein
MSALSVEQLSRELMRVLRGPASQRAYSRALGFTSNVAYSWETGRRFPEASVFLRAAGRNVAGFDAAARGVLSLGPGSAAGQEVLISVPDCQLVTHRSVSLAMASTTSGSRRRRDRSCRRPRGSR